MGIYTQDHKRCWCNVCVALMKSGGTCLCLYCGHHYYLHKDAWCCNDRYDEAKDLNDKKEW